MSKPKIKRLIWDIEDEFCWRVDPYYTYILIGGHVVVLSDSHRAKGALLSQQITSDGYLRHKINGKYVCDHAAVAEHFFGHRPSGKVVNHKDGNKLNNHPSNLEYVTQRENIHHAIDMGLHVASDPTKMPTYRDGRCKNRLEYKRQWRNERRNKGLKVT